MKFPLFIIIASHLSDVQELVAPDPAEVGGVNDRLNFAKWLLNKYHDDTLSADIDANDEWAEFQTSKTNRK